jgi:hypothetical protein
MLRLFLRFFNLEYGDPTGIRTPVTAVKGRCPRPLDDRVIYMNWRPHGDSNPGYRRERAMS